MSVQLLFIPGLISSELAWKEVQLLCEKAGWSSIIADVSDQDSIQNMASSVLEQSSNDQIIPIGHSMGGRVAMEMFALAPERIRALCLVATGGHPLAEGEREKREAVIEMANVKGMDALVEQWLPPMVGPDFSKKAPQRYEALYSMSVSAGAVQHERQIRALVNRPNAFETLKKVNVPTLFVAGHFDQWSPPEQHQAMQKLVTNSQTDLEVLEAGHFVQFEEPHVFSETLLAWLEKIDI